jgi:6-phosphogluconolactonase
VVRIEVVSGDGSQLAPRAAMWIADRLWTAVDERGQAHLAVSGGTTPAAMLAALSDLALPWESTHVWQVDERVAPDGDPARNLNDLNSRLLSKVPAIPHVFDVTAEDLADAARAYAADLDESCGGVLDVVHLGLGDDGHTASWPPGDPVANVVDTDATVSSEYMGHVRLTLTVPAVNRARDIMFLVAGEAKADAVGKLMAGDSGIPASHVRRAGTVILADAAAGAAAAGSG